MYDYYDAMKRDIIDHIADRYTLEDIIDKLDDPDDWKETLNSDCWIDDSVTGNASGSYTFNSVRAKEYVIDNMELCTESLSEFCIESKTISDHFLREDWEYFDVAIRCYILYGVVNDLVEALTECREALEAETEINREILENLIAA